MQKGSGLGVGEKNRLASFPLMQISRTVTLMVYDCFQRQTIKLKTKKGINSNKSESKMRNDSGKRKTTLPLSHFSFCQGPWGSQHTCRKFIKNLFSLENQIVFVLKK